MSDRPSHPQPGNLPPDHDSEVTVLERVQELTWALLDEQIDDDEAKLLDNLLLSDDLARKRYVECVQLHCDLIGHFAKPAVNAAGSASGSPVLGFLSTGMPPMEAHVPFAEE